VVSQGCRCAPTAGLKLANAFGVFVSDFKRLKLANAFGVFVPIFKLLKLANAFGVFGSNFKLRDYRGMLT
jgi:hypothetical protein